ncbi:hypothetical protein [Bacillus benzoevorans]|uniref:Uncharacterized protein n=1 Tax=Bacillus benzoevorans TaxID=1456 RepID=A0A7X0HVG3_9BACI|nr:hypothetical protein [Bacillus benzoevorans]MBB6447558.1 hypothetical protein [Bacillus benzoevorans]
MCDSQHIEAKLAAAIQSAVLKEHAHRNALFWLGKTPVFPGVRNTLVKKG